jgi:hypothetical protein
MPGKGGLPLTDMVSACLDNSPGATVDIEVLNAELNALPVDETARQLRAAALEWGEGFERR